MSKIIYENDEAVGFVCNNCDAKVIGEVEHENCYGKPICQACKDYGDKHAQNDKRYGAYL